MYLFGYYIDKKVIRRILLVIIILAAIVIGVKIRTSKNKIYKVKYEGIVEEIEDIENGGDPIDGYLAIYNFDTIMPYFQSVGDALEFEEYLKNFIKDTDTIINEWWIVDPMFNSTSCELTFYIMSNENEYFKVIKNNETTKITHTHEKY